MKANIYDVAAYIINESGPMPLPKLEILLYYCLAYSLIYDKIPLFKNNFKVLHNGVTSGAFDHIKDLVGNDDIDLFHDVFICSDINLISNEHKLTIDEVLDNISNLSLNELIRMLQLEYPWLHTYSNNLDIIDRKDMKQYYDSF